MSRLVAVVAGCLLTVLGGSAAAVTSTSDKAPAVSRAEPVAAQRSVPDRAPATAKPAAKVSSKDDCAPLTEGTFGTLTDQQRATGRLAANTSVCFSVTATGGPHWVRHNHFTTAAYDWTLRTSGGDVACAATAQVLTACTVATPGTYTLHLTNKQPQTPWDYEVAFVALSGSQGCAAPTGTAWTVPATSAEQTSGTQVFCLPFDAPAGQAVSGFSSTPSRALADAAGTWLCLQPVCVLPATGGPFRLLVPTPARVAGPTIFMEVHGITQPVGCPAITLAAYGAGPNQAANSVQCRTFTVDRAGRYWVRGSREITGEVTQHVYDADGRNVCTTYLLFPCELPQAGAYVTINRAVPAAGRRPYVVNVVPASGPGCVPVSDRGAATAAHSADISTPAEVDCLQLATEAGATVRIFDRRRQQSPVKPEVSVGPAVYDADGTYLCSANVICVLRGAAPFRVVVQTIEDAGTYALAIQRVSGASGCPAMPAPGREGTVTVSPGRHTQCLSFTVTGAGRRVVSWRNESGSGRGLLQVYSSTGRQRCENSSLEKTFACELDESGTHTVVLNSDGDPATYRIGLAHVCPSARTTSSDDKGTAPSSSPAGATPCVRQGKLR